MTKAITILSESDDKTLCVSITGVISAAIFLECFIQPIRTIIERRGEFNLCAIYNDYEGWESDAAEASFKYYAEVGAQGRRLAYVNAPDSRFLLLKMLEPILPNAEIRFFEPEDRGEAIAWAKG